MKFFDIKKVGRVFSGLLLFLGLSSTGFCLSFLQPVQLVIYDNGKEFSVDVKQQLANELIALCEQQIASADSVAKLATTSQLIDSFHAKGLTIEIKYRSSKSFVIPRLKRTIVVRRLLIPLSGELSGSVTTLFYGKGEYDIGPLRNSKGTEHLKEISLKLIS